MLAPRAAVALLVLAAALAGCVGSPAPAPALPDLAPPSAERFGALPGESFWIEASSDGTPLHLSLFLPDTGPAADWKAPTILVMSPYFGADAREDPFDPSSEPTYFRYQWLLDHFVPRGYAVAFADVRGTGDSGGCLEQTAQLQWQDGYDTVEWLAAQPWSNGRVGMFGKSYDGETQQSTAVMAPPSLATIVPVSSVSGQYEYNFYEGVPFTGFPFTPGAFASNLFYALTDGLQPPTSAEGLAAYPTRAGCHPAMLVQGLDTTGDWNAFWEEREIRKRAGDVRAAVLYVHGLQDWNVKPVAIRDWLDKLPAATTRAILGQWAHDYPEENRWNKDWSRTDWRTTVHAWYDHFLLGLDNGILDALPPVQVQDTAGTWRREASWPPQDAVPLRLALGDGTLALAPADGAAEGDLGLRLRENAEDYAASNSQLPVPALPLEGATQLAFDGEPLAADLHLSGWPALALTLTPDVDDAHLAALLLDVAPDGEATWINRGYLSLRHRDGVEAPAPASPGEAHDVRIVFFPMDAVVPAGHALRLVLAGSDAWTMPQQNGWTATLHAGILELPAIERDWAAVTLPVEFGPPVAS